MCSPGRRTDGPSTVACSWNWLLAVLATVSNTWVTLGNGGTRHNSGAASIFGFPGGQTINFSPMPAVRLPQKAAVPAG
jgi:hypothetical protein